MNHPPASPRVPAVDAHAHVFSSDLQLATVRRYAPVYDAPLETYLQHLDAHGIEQAVLVQPSFLGTDNGYLLQALAREPGRLKGVAVLSPDVRDEELRRLHDRGITGLRLNLVGQPLPDLESPPWSALWRRIAPFGWHVELHREARDLAPLIDSVLAAGLPVVVDHFGRPDPALGIRDAGFDALLGFARSRRVWVKVSAAYRCAAPADIAGFVRDASDRLLTHFGSDRLMWGSDWPHTQFEQAIDYDASLSTLLRLPLDAAVLEAITRSTPHAFYGFGDPSAARPRDGARAAHLFLNQ